jgi:hypothetical protein
MSASIDPISKYWSLANLDSSGKLKITAIAAIQKFVQEQFPQLIEREKISNTALQRDLLIIRQSQDTTGVLSDRSLRCFISHQIKQICIQLELQFGREHGFSRFDLFLYTLNDTLDNFRNAALTNSRQPSQYKPLAVRILETFAPQKASLSTWTTRIVKQDRELQSFLLQQGVYLISNWAILNDTNLKQLGKILGEFYNLTPTEIDRASVLLSSYHAVYRQDRLQNIQSKGEKCQPPSEEQLSRMAQEIKAKSNNNLYEAEILFQLEQLAHFLREYRIQVRGGKQIASQSLDNSEINTEALQASAIQDEEDDDSDRTDFLQVYQEQFKTSLDKAISLVIEYKLSKFKGKKAAKAPLYLSALKLFHCQGLSMSAIAKEIGLEAQYQVTRLIQLKDLRADIRHKMLQLMSEWVVKTTQSNLDPEQLKQREQEIELALGEQIDTIMEKAEKAANIAESNNSLFAQRICHYLD